MGNGDSELQTRKANTHVILLEAIVSDVLATALTRSLCHDAGFGGSSFRMLKRRRIENSSAKTCYFCLVEVCKVANEYQADARIQIARPTV
jgi:hypothetical protein